MIRNKKKYCQNNSIVSSMLNNKYVQTLYDLPLERIYLKYDTYFTGIKYFREHEWY